jgi:hypothetical protein
MLLEIRMSGPTVAHYSGSVSGHQSGSGTKLTAFDCYAMTRLSPRAPSRTHSRVCGPMPCHRSWHARAIRRCNVNASGMLYRKYDISQCLRGHLQEAASQPLRVFPRLWTPLARPTLRLVTIQFCAWLLPSLRLNGVTPVTLPV